MATTPSTNETLDKVTPSMDNTDEAIANQAIPADTTVTHESHTSKVHTDVEDGTDGTDEANEPDEASELSEALERADKSVMADDMAKDSTTVDVSAFMSAEPLVEEKECSEPTPNVQADERLDVQSGVIETPVAEQTVTDTAPESPASSPASSPAIELDAVTGQQDQPKASPVTSSIESDLAAEEAALAAEALAVTASMGDEEKAKKAAQEKRKAEIDQELEAAQAERRAKVEKALQAKPNRIKPEPEPDEEEEEPLSLLDHLSELRVRVVRCFIAIGLGFMLCYSFAERIFNELMVPLVSAMPPDSKLIFTALPEAFFVYMQVAFVAAIFVVSPYIFYQVWAFISPGLYEEEKKTAIPIAFFSATFFISGAAFCYFQVFPYAFQFFMGFATDLILPMPSLSEYLSFALKMLIAFGLIFEMPLFAFFLSRIGLVTADMMRKFRKYAVLCMFIVAAILTPPDVFSQTLMAGPMILLYEISILIAAVVGKKKKDESEEGQDEEGAQSAEKPSTDSSRPMQGD